MQLVTNRPCRGHGDRGAGRVQGRPIGTTECAVQERAEHEVLAEVRELAHEVMDRDELRVRCPRE